MPVKDRAKCLDEINAAMDRIAGAIEDGITGATRALARLGAAEIKIETSPVTRGVVHDPEQLEVSEAVEGELGYATMNIVSFEDLLGGKLHAAVDRQHPRDL